MQIKIRASNQTLGVLPERLPQGYKPGPLRWVKRIHALLYIIDGKSVTEVAAQMQLSAEAVRNYGKKYKRPPDRPPKLTKTQSKELAELIDAGREAAGYDCGCWDSPLIQDLISTRYKVEYTPQYVAQLLKQMGFSYQQARFVSQHIDDLGPAQETWMPET